MGVGLRVLPVILLVACDAGEKPRGVQATAPRTCVEAAGWSPISTKNAPPASERLLHAVVDDKLLVVGPAGGRLLDPCTDTWTTIDTTNMPPHLVGYGADLPGRRRGS